MRSVRRKFTQPRQPVEPLTLTHLTQLNRHVSELSMTCNLVAWRTVWRLNMEYYTLCRFSEINQLHSTDLTFIPLPQPHYQIRIRKSKTDQFGSGDMKVIFSSPTNSNLCPVLLTQNYLTRLAQPAANGPYHGVLQPRVHFDHSSQTQTALKDQILCYSTSLDDTKQLFKTLSIFGRFGEHSGRRGGASAAAGNGASVAELQRLGNWKSTSCALKYVEHDASTTEKTFRLLYPKP